MSLQKRYYEASISGLVPPLSEEARVLHTLYGSISSRSAAADAINTGSVNMKKGKEGLSNDDAPRGPR